MTIVLPHGVLFRGGDEGKIRKNLIEKDKIDIIIGLPANVFFGTSISTVIMVLKRNRPSSDVLIIDASKEFEKDGKNNKLRSCDIKKISDAVRERKSIGKYAALVSKETIVKNEYNLNIPRYVDSSEDSEQWDMRSIMFGGIPKVEVEQLEGYWGAFPGMKEAIFKSVSEKYMAIGCADIKSTVIVHPSSIEYKKNFARAFDGFYELLKKDLIDDILDVQAESEKEKICDVMFTRLSGVMLTDKYYAYQILSDKWNIISTDLEMIQAEGFEVINQVDPNMVIKKKDSNSDEIPEIQEGWKGHILPFELVQREILTDDLRELEALEERLEEIGSLYTDIIDSMEEEESSVLNDSNDAFVSKEVKSTVAEILQDVENEEIISLKKYLGLSKKKEKLDYVEKCLSIKWETMEPGADGTYKKTSVNNRIRDVQLEYQFDKDSFENKMITVLKLQCHLDKIFSNKNSILPSAYY